MVNRFYIIESYLSLPNNINLTFSAINSIVSVSWKSFTLSRQQKAHLSVVCVCMRKRAPALGMGNK